MEGERGNEKTCARMNRNPQERTRTPQMETKAKCADPLHVSRKPADLQVHPSHNPLFYLQQRLPLLRAGSTAGPEGRRPWGPQTRCRKGPFPCINPTTRATHNRIQPKQRAQIMHPSTETHSADAGFRPRHKRRIAGQHYSGLLLVGQQGCRQRCCHEDILSARIHGGLHREQ